MNQVAVLVDHRSHLEARVLPLCAGAIVVLSAVTGCKSSGATAAADAASAGGASGSAQAGSPHGGSVSRAETGRDDDAGAGMAGMSGTADASPPMAKRDGGSPAAAVRAAPETRLESSEWSSYGHDLHLTRHNPGERRIGRENVSRLVLKWSWEKVAVNSTPIYAQGKLYFGDWDGYVVSLDAKTGTELWRTRNPAKQGGSVRTSPFVTQDAVFVGSDSGYFERVERRDGARDWASIVDEGGSLLLDSSPVVLGNLVIAGVASYQNVNPVSVALLEQPFRGSIVARDANTGAPAWQFKLTTGTGVSVCSSPAIDVQRKLLFVGTGQNYDKANDSPYADSLIALHYETGAYVWHHQFSAGDFYSLGGDMTRDLDVLSSPVLFTADNVDMVAAGDKGGTVKAFDRDGNIRWMRKLSPGGHHGGVMGSPAYHDGVIYICSGDFTTDQGDGIGQSGPAKSTLFAINAADGVLRWSAPVASLCYGAVSHANGLVYLPTGDGFVRAFDDTDGRELWQANLGESSAGGVSIADGMVYVSYGWDWILPAVAGGVKAFGLP